MSGPPSSTAPHSLSFSLLPIKAHEPPLPTKNQNAPQKQRLFVLSSRIHALRLTLRARRDHAGDGAYAAAYVVWQRFPRHSLAAPSRAPRLQGTLHCTFFQEPYFAFLWHPISTHYTHPIPLRKNVRLLRAPRFNWRLARCAVRQKKRLLVTWILLHASLFFAFLPAKYWKIAFLGGAWRGGVKLDKENCEAKGRCAEPHSNASQSSEADACACRVIGPEQSSYSCNPGRSVAFT